MRESDVRTALRVSALRKYLDDGHSRVVDELALCRGEARVDIAVINGQLIGYELKSAADTLERLEAQAAVYSRVFDVMHLVIAESHLEHARPIVPEWWGLLAVKESTRGKLSIRKVRDARKNPAVDVGSVVQLLWREESLGLLAKYGMGRGLQSQTRERLWQVLAEVLPCDTLRDEVRAILKSREAWRLPRAPREVA